MEQRYDKVGCAKKCCRLWPLALKKAKRKKPEIGLITGFFDGGELGIRTLGTFLYTTFRVSHLRPLGQLSVYFLNCSFLIRKRFGENYRREQEKIFDFNVLKPRWIKGFVRTKPPKLRRISSFAPSTTRTTLQMCTKLLWKKQILGEKLGEKSIDSKIIIAEKSLGLKDF